MKKFLTATFIILFSFLLIWLQENSVLNSSCSTSICLVRVIDGDTIVVKINNRQEKVRYIGIDTPELTKTPCIANKAKEYNALLLKGAKQIILEKDVRNRDKYGRLLRYIYVVKNNKKIFVNAELVKNGWAKVLTIPPDVKYSKLFLELYKQARKKQLGIWNPNVCKD